MKMIAWITLELGKRK